MEQVRDVDVRHVHSREGIERVFLRTYENRTTVNLEALKAELGAPPWVVRVAYNERFGGTLIAQNPGEGNRLHYHPDADECWVIMEGELEWYIEGQGTRRVSQGDIVVVTRGTRHKITCVGTAPGIRFAITKPDVEHVYSKEDY
jgi:quercetin dioxygenase-like cupin family protein